MFSILTVAVLTQLYAFIKTHWIEKSNIELYTKKGDFTVCELYLNKSNSKVLKFQFCPLVNEIFGRLLLFFDS